MVEILHSEQKNREANREAELHRAEEEEEDEDRDPVEREEMLRRESKQRKALLNAERLAREQAAVERDNMCDSIWTMCLANRDVIMSSMEESWDYGRSKSEWEAQKAAKEEAEHAEARRKAFMVNPDAIQVSDHWGDPKLTPGEVQLEAAIACEAPVTSEMAGPSDSDTEDAGSLVRTVRGRWGVAPSTGRSSSMTKGGSTTASASGTGSHGGRSDQRRSSSLTKGDRGAGRGVKFTLKRTLQNRKSPPSLAPAMTAAAEFAAMEEEALPESTGDAATSIASDSAGATKEGHNISTTVTDDMDIENPSQDLGSQVGAAYGGGLMEVEDAVLLPSEDGDKRTEGNLGKIGGAVELGASRDVVRPTASKQFVPNASQEGNVVHRVDVTISEPLLAGALRGTGCAREEVNLSQVLREDPFLFRMYWPEGLVLIKGVIKDAPGGQGCPSVNIVQSPSKLVVDALGARITLSSPQESTNGVGFAALCSQNGVNSMNSLRDNIHQLSTHVEQHARGGDERLSRVEHLSEKRVVLDQIGEILEDGAYRYMPALGGIWLAVRHSPSIRQGGNGWITGAETPAVEVRILMRRLHLDDRESIGVLEDESYARKAADSISAAAAAVAAHTGDTSAEGENQQSVGSTAATQNAADYVTALGEDIYDGHVREVVSDVLDDAVRKVMMEGGKPADLRDAVVWKAASTRRARLSHRGMQSPMSRMFSFDSDQDDG